MTYGRDALCAWLLLRQAAIAFQQMARGCHVTGAGSLADSAVFYSAGCNHAGSLSADCAEACMMRRRGMRRQAAGRQQAEQGVVRSPLRYSLKQSSVRNKLAVVRRLRPDCSTSAARGGKTEPGIRLLLSHRFARYETALNRCTLMAANLQDAGVCILSAEAPQPQVNAAVFQARGLRVRTVSTCVADVLLASASLAMLVIPSAELQLGAADADRHWDRCKFSQALSLCDRVYLTVRPLDAPANRDARSSQRISAEP